MELCCAASITNNRTTELRTREVLCCFYEISHLCAYLESRKTLRYGGVQRPKYINIYNYKEKNRPLKRLGWLAPARQLYRSPRRSSLSFPDAPLYILRLSSEDTTLGDGRLLVVSRGPSPGTSGRARLGYWISTRNATPTLLRSTSSNLIHTSPG